MPIHIGSVQSKVTIAGHDADLVELVLQLVLERLRSGETGTMEETVIRDRLTTQR